MYFSKKSAGALVFSQIILVFALLIVLVGQVSALPAPEALPDRHVDNGDFGNAQ